MFHSTRMLRSHFLNFVQVYVVACVVNYLFSKSRWFMQRTVVTLLRDKNVVICELIQVNREAISLTCAFGARFPLTQGEAHRYSSY